MYERVSVDADDIVVGIVMMKMQDVSTTLRKTIGKQGIRLIL